MARTTFLCPAALATSKGVWQASLIIEVFAGNWNKNKQYLQQKWRLNELSDIGRMQNKL